MFKTRLVSGIFLVAVILLLFLTGRMVLLLGMLLISLIGMFELYRVFRVEKSLAGGMGYLFTVVYYFSLRWGIHNRVSLLISAFMVVLLAVYVFSYPKYRADQIFAVFFGFFYIGWMLSYIYELRSLDKGIWLVWLVMLCSWGSDTCAYCVGVLFGKHKMAPVLSPKKSVEGAVGGVVGAMLLTGIFCILCRESLSLSLHGIAVLMAAVGMGALLSMVGDLAASAIKRNYDIKDYGTLIPGHGGILDRFDSVIITAPVIFYFCSFLYQ